MEVKTKFAIGDKISVIDDHKVIDMMVDAVVITSEGIKYRDSNYKCYQEEDCFSNRREVVEHILGNTENADSDKNQ